MGEKPIMTCGCRAMAVTENDTPACPVHDCYEVATQQPDLTGRTARCVYCKTKSQSNSGLPFFEYLGDGSREATDICANDGYARVAHDITPRPSHLKRLCDNFTPRGGSEHDRFYCGCRGWD